MKAESCEHANKIINYRKSGIIPEKLHDYQGFTKDSDHWIWLVPIIL